jgi:glucose-1-phosphate cytidylyltransferase
MVNEYFLNYRPLNTDFTVNLATGKLTPHQSNHEDWSVRLVDTGLKSMTGRCVK